MWTLGRLYGIMTFLMPRWQVRLVRVVCVDGHSFSWKQRSALVSSPSSHVPGRCAFRTSVAQGALEGGASLVGLVQLPLPLTSHFNTFFLLDDIDGLAFATSLNTPEFIIIILLRTVSALLSPHWTHVGCLRRLLPDYVQHFSTIRNMSASSA